MIDLNIEPIHKDFFNINRFRFEIESEKLRGMLKKHNGWVNVKISKPEEKGTASQNKAIHSLMTVLFLSNLHSYNANGIAEFKDMLKADFGVFQVMEHKGESYKLLKSWSQYNKGERSKFIDAVVSLCHQCGAYVDNDDVRTVIDGMESDK